MVVSDDYVEARLSVELPSRQGRVLGDAAKDVFFQDLPALVSATLIYCNLDEVETELFVNTMEDADQIRQSLPSRGLISFVGDGALTARRSRSDQPDPAQAAPLEMADELKIQIDVPNAGAVQGLGIPSGITVILGDEFSGRAELLKALAAGIYNHIPGDGREHVITTPDAVYVSAERARSVQRVDLGAFVRGGAESDVRALSTSAAEPCIAQMVSTVEALEVGARALFFDEAEAASGFLSADSRLSGLLADGRGPQVIPLSARARAIADELGVSIVVGGCNAVAEFIPVADTVLKIENNRITAVTREAKDLGIAAATVRPEDVPVGSLVSKTRWVIASSIDPSSGRHDAVIAATAVDQLQFGRTVVDLRGIYQLADSFQTATIGLILYYAKLRYMDEGRPIREILDLVDRDLSTEGLECLSRDLRGDLARPRRYEIAAALNRLASLRISHAAE